MLIALKNQEEIGKLKVQLKGKFEMKDLRELKKILGMEITRDKQSKKLFFLSQKEYLKRVLNRFGMNERTKLVSTPLIPHFKFSVDMSPKDEDE